MTDIKHLERVWRESPEIAKIFVPKHLRTKINELSEELAGAQQLLSEIEGFDSVRKDVGDLEAKE